MLLECHWQELEVPGCVSLGMSFASQHLCFSEVAGLMVPASLISLYFYK